ncbi:MAG TPA: methyltransferase [Ktedonobacteraceae bacterium]|jgi:16S rRNA (guanine1207-N2)-methyltransferase|nr:methyltransferase [Ktedonobacteraceae bacterium]
MNHPSLFNQTVQLALSDAVLVLNSASDPFVIHAAQSTSGGKLLLAEDNIAALQMAQQAFEQARIPLTASIRHIPFHEYTVHEPPATMNVAVMNLLYQPSNAWMHYGLQVAAYALKPGGRLYVQGAKTRGILTIAKRMEALFGNVETLEIHKGERVVCSRVGERPVALDGEPLQTLQPFAEGKLDEGTRLLLETLEVRATDVALDIGCGAGYLGMHIALRATKGQVTMVDASLAAVDLTRRKVEESGLENVQVLASNGVQAMASQRFDLVVTNPPFHMGGVQTLEIGEQFIRGAAQVLRPRGRFYLVANRFLKYEPTMRSCFKTMEEVARNTSFKVLRGTMV